MKKQLLTLVMMLLPMAISAHDIEVQNSDGVTIYYNYINDGTELEVTYRANDCTFDKNRYTGNFVIPEEVTYMNMTRKVTSIGKRAFCYCSGLVSVTIPNSLTSIGFAAFQGCSSLTYIEVSPGNTKYDSRNNCNAIIETASNTLVLGCKNTVIPNSVTSIGANAFWDCTGLTSVTIPNSVTSIGESAFWDCTGLTSVTIPNSVTSIDERAFDACSGLTSVTLNSNAIASKTYTFSSSLNNIFGVQVTEYIIGNEVQSIGQYAFCGCSDLASVTVNNSLTSIGERAFYDCSKLTSINIPNSVTSIGGYAFSGCSSLASINIPNSLTTINSAAFQGCSSLTSVTIPNSVTSIGNTAFNNCKGLTTVTIPNSVTSIGTTAFSRCSNLTSVTIGNSVTSIGKFAFEYCSSLTSITIPNSVTYIGSSAFENCISIISIKVSPENARYDSRNNCNAIIETESNTLVLGCKNTVIPNSVTSIGGRPFAYCSGLTSITIPNSVTSIGANAFLNCTGLTSVTIPNSVTSIGKNAFGDCSILTSVIVNISSPLSISNGVFSNCANATLYVPYGCKTAYEAADYWKEFKEIKEIADDIAIGSASIATYCSTYALDFSGTDDIKAYVVSAFKPSTGEVTLTRISDVPANTGIIVKGDADTYTIPWGFGETIVSNMLVGVTANTVLNKVDGDYTNYILAKKNEYLGFYAVSDGTTLGAGKAYLPLPTASLPSGTGARGVQLIFDDEQTTDITEIESKNDAIGEIYNLQGRKVANPTKGLYIVNGKKITIK